MSDYPKQVECSESVFTFARFERKHLAAVQSFARKLPDHDLLFLSRDIQHLRVIEAWIEAIERGEIISLVALEDRAVVGTSAVVRDPLSWSAHVAEIRLLIAPDLRGRGLGRVLLQHCFIDAVEAGAEKLVARMTPDQRAAISLFEEMGFRGEAMLRDHVKDRQGQLHDLAMLSLDVARASAMRDAYGYSSA